MPLFKEVWQYESKPSGFWSEVFHSSSSDITAAARFTPGELTKRLVLLDDSNKLRKIRVSSVLPPFRSLEFPVNRLGSLGKGVVVEGGGPANLDEAAVVRLVSSARPSKRNWWMRGLSEEDVFRVAVTGETHLFPGFLERLNGFLQFLAANNYVVLTRKKDGEGGVIKRQLLSVDGTAGDGTSVLTFPASPGVAAGDRLEIRQANPKLLPGLNGPFEVLGRQGDDPLKPIVRYRTPADALITQTLAYALKIEYWDDAVINAALSGFAYLGSRRSKNVSTGSRGARKAIRLRHLH